MNLTTWSQVPKFAQGLSVTLPLKEAPTIHSRTLSGAYKVSGIGVTAGETDRMM